MNIINHFFGVLLNPLEIYLPHTHTHTHIYIYIYRERERESGVEFSGEEVSATVERLYVNNSNCNS